MGSVITAARKPSGADAADPRAAIVPRHRPGAAAPRYIELALAQRPGLHGGHRLSLIAPIYEWVLDVYQRVGGVHQGVVSPYSRTDLVITLCLGGERKGCQQNQKGGFHIGISQSLF